MKIKILFFATLREYVGAKTIELEIPVDTTVAGLKELLVSRYPKMLPARNSILSAINREYAVDEQVIPLNAEIALFPPVSGG
ncbi:MAG: molybdopterin converting factor subunit 1 [Anaerolineales bacterium]|jgi:molybdopterin converting factor subunit 1